MKVFITKYALTQGIIEIDDAEICSIAEKMISSPKYGYFFEKEWHDTQAEAIAFAEEMRIKKIASLKKQIAKLEKINFNQK